MFVNNIFEYDVNEIKLLLFTIIADYDSYHFPTEISEYDHYNNFYLSI